MKSKNDISKLSTALFKNTNAVEINTDYIYTIYENQQNSVNNNIHRIPFKLIKLFKHIHSTISAVAALFTVESPTMKKYKIITVVSLQKLLK